MRPNSPRNRRALPRFARATWLALLAVVALHPLSTAASSGSAGLAVLLRELLCGCSNCAAEVAPTPEPVSCCEREAEREAGRDCGPSGCACSHPDEVPLAHVTPIAPSNADERTWLDATDGQRQVAVQFSSGAGLERELCASRAAVECRPPPDRLQHATHARRVPATRERLAWLATALI